MEIYVSLITVAIILFSLLIIQAFLKLGDDTSTLKKFKIDSYKAKHDNSTGLCTIELEGSGLEYKFTENSITLNFVIDKIKNNDFYAIFNGENFEGFLVNDVMYTMNSQTISPINTKAFGLITILLFVLTVFCSIKYSNLATMGFLTFMTLILFINEKIMDKTVTNSVLSKV